MLEGVKRQRVTEQTLLQRLTDYVDRIDTDLVRSAHRDLHYVCSFINLAYIPIPDDEHACLPPGLGVSDAARVVRFSQGHPIFDAQG